MQKPTKFKKEDYRKIWIMSDLHLNQKSGVILKGRGFETMEEHDKFIFQFWENNVTEEDLVINLGDVVFNDMDAAVFDKVASLPCKKHVFLTGNHLSGASRRYTETIANLGMTGFCVYPLQYKKITFVGEYFPFCFSKKVIHACHFPISVWDNRAIGTIHLCGHSHGSFSGSNGEEKDGKILDVGVEMALKITGRPFFEWQEIVDYMNNREIGGKDHHTEGFDKKRGISPEICV